MSVLVEDLQEFDYYIKKLPLYLQSNEEFITHFRIWYDFLIGKEDIENDGLIGAGDVLLDLFNINDPYYLEKINLYGSDLLDKLGSIFNIKRNFSVTYNENGIQVTKNLNLNNKNFLLFLKSQIIKNYSDGSYEQMRKFYNDNGLYIYLKKEGPAEANVYLLNIPDSTEEYDDDIKDIFKTGLLTIKSMGIKYNHSMQEYNKMLVWDKEVTEDYTGWAESDNPGEWVI